MVLPVGGRKPGIPERTLFDLNAFVSPGDDGDIKATVGGVIRNIKPGRIDARVRGLSPSASKEDNTSVLNALQAEAATSGAELWIPDGEYNGRLLVDSPHLRVRGTGTIRNATANEHVVYVSAADADIGGIAVDCLGTSNMAGVYIASDDTHVHGVTFRNAAAPAIDHVGDRTVRRSRIINNRFYDVYSGVRLNRANGVWIIGNEGENISDNFITIWIINAPDETISNIRIERNIGRSLGRMLIEIWSANGTDWRYADAWVVGNEGYWDAPDGDEQYGISMAGIDRGVVALNKIIKTGAPNTVPTEPGIEIVNSRKNRVSHNTVEGFNDGIVIDNAPDATVVHNWIYLCNRGVRIENASRRPRVDFNTIDDCRDNGISFNNAASFSASYNTIRRAAEWADDANRTFSAISHGTLSEDSWLVRNEIELDQETPSLSVFTGIRHNGTAGTGKARLFFNTVRSRSVSAFGSGIFANSGTSSVTGYEYVGNEFRNLASAANTAIGSGNVTGHSNRQTVSSQNLHLGVFADALGNYTATATLDFSEIAAGATDARTITVTGASVGDAVYLGPPSTLESGLIATGYVSAANTVTVRLANVTAGAIDPASATWRATVVKA